MGAAALKKGLLQQTSWHLMGTPGIGEEPSPAGEGVSEHGQQVVPDCAGSDAFSALQGQDVYDKAFTRSRAYVYDSGTQWTLGAASACCFCLLLSGLFQVPFLAFFHCHLNQPFISRGCWLVFRRGESTKSSLKLSVHVPLAE